MIINSPYPWLSPECRDCLVLALPFGHGGPCVIRAAWWSLNNYSLVTTSGPGHLVTASLGYSACVTSLPCCHFVCRAVKHPTIMTWFASCQSIRTFCLDQVVYIVNKIIVLSRHISIVSLECVLPGNLQSSPDAAWPHDDALIIPISISKPGPVPGASSCSPITGHHGVIMSVRAGEMISDELNVVSKSSTHASGLIEVCDDLRHCLWNWIILRIIYLLSRGLASQISSLSRL